MGQGPRSRPRSEAGSTLPAMRAVLRHRAARFFGIGRQPKFSIPWLRTFVMTKKQYRCEPLVWVVVLTGSLGLASCGSPNWQGLFRAPPPPSPIGTINDQYWTQQE